MIAFLLAMANVDQVATTAVPPPVRATQQPTALMPPQDWSTLPLLRLLRPFPITDDVSAYVRAEVLAGRCAAVRTDANGSMLTIQLAVLSTPAGRIRRVVPSAIDCPTVEQYASGLVLRMARENLDVSGATADTWYRTSLTFMWR